MNIKDFKQLKPEDMPQKIRQLTSSLSVQKNMPLYALYLKMFFLESFAFLNPFSQIEAYPTAAKYAEKFASFRDLCVFLDQKNLYVNVIEKDNSSSSYYYSRSAQKYSFSSQLLNAYCRSLDPYKPKNSAPIIEALTALKNMGDEVKAKEISFDLRALRQQDRLVNRELDPVFCHVLELYGFDMFSSKEAISSMWQIEKNPCIRQALSIPALLYFEALENAAQKENKTAAFENLVRKELTNFPDTHNELIDKWVEKLEISKEKKHFEATLKNYNKKEIKKRAKEKKAQELLLSQSAVPSVPKKSKFKL